MRRAYGSGPVLTEFGSLAQFMRARPDLASIYTVEGSRCRLDVLGVGSFAFLPYQDATLLNFVQPGRWVGSIEEALAGLGVVATRFVSTRPWRLEGPDDV